ncbi:MAG: hypothetical protein ACPG19_04230 [Saprospiraceae bacterium]
MKTNVTISRRKFIRVSSIGVASILSTNPFNTAFASTHSDYIIQLELIDNIKSYCRNHLGMQLGSYFYTNWELNDGYLHYLYVSNKHKVGVPTGLQEFYYFGTDIKAALSAADNFKRKGYHTMVYQTAGTSATLLNKALMSYSMDAIAMVVFHEALHVHLRNTNKDIPLSIEEAAADVLAKYVAKTYQKESDLIKRRSLRRTVKTMEYIYKTVNHSCEDLEKGKIDQDIIFNKCYKRIKNKLKKANSYQQTRFSYPVNNAFFVRNSYYSKYYFDLEKLYKKLDKSPERFIDFIGKLPKNLDAALLIIKTQKLIS